jgi:NAD(P)-dependent dehydrogenase (short-subunit alcohol dehydrogenase family)
VRLTGAICIVTGSSAGIGAACARRFAAKGARVVLNHTKSEAAANAVARECKSAGGDAIVVRGDVSLDADCRALAQATLDTWGRIDVLVNNAGTTKFASHADLDALQADDFMRIFGVNLVGPYQMIRAVAPAMRESGAGAVVNVSSVAGVLGVGSSVAYAASKGALNTMTLSLARALAPVIRVNAVCPGFVETDWLRAGLGADFAKHKASWEAIAPLKSTLLPDDIAQSVLWLVEGGDKITGEVIMIDSGFHLGGAPLRAR